MSLMFEFPDDLMLALQKLEDEELEIECLEAVQDVIVDSVQKELSKHDQTGELSNSIKSNGVKKSKKGDNYYVFISPTGYSKNFYYGGKNHNRKYRVSNGAKAVWLQYGTSKESPKPWLESAKKNCEQQVIDIIQEKINEKIGE